MLKEKLQKERKHRHHKIPKHMGGTDDESNLTDPISIKDHAEEHRKLWIKHGFKQDYIAWKCLSGRITNEEARLMAAKIGQENSAKYKESRKFTGECAKASATFDSRSKGGKTASKVLVQWQKANKEKFIKQCKINAKNGAIKRLIPHEYLGVIYKSKKELQAAHKMSICGFYGKLKRGEIKRL